MTEPMLPSSPSWFAIPTAGRPKELGRCLRSFVSGMSQTSSSHRVLVSDDSKTVTASNEARAALTEACGSKQESYFIERSARARLAQRLASGSGISRAIVNFALFGVEGAGPTYGANQNVIQLLTKGHAVTIVDDDIVLLPSRHRDYLAAQSLSSSNEEIISEGHPERSWFFNSQAEAVAAIAPIRGNAVELLGQGLLERGPLQNRRTVIATLGLYGDSGMRSSAHLLATSNRETRASLLADPNTLETGLRSRAVVRHAMQDTLCPAKGFLTAAYALDNRVPLLPFVPNGRGSDAIFGRSVGAAWPTYDMCFVGAAVWHDPPGKRLYSGNAGTVTLSSTISACLDFAANIPRTECKEDGAQFVGSFFEQLASGTDSYFGEVIAYALTTQLNSIADSLLEILYDAETPPLFARHLARAVADIESALGDPKSLIPNDIAGSDTEAQMKSLKGILAHWGSACLSWAEVEREAMKIDLTEFRITPI